MEESIMGKDMHLINIYLKIHHKRTITLDDLRYLAQYDPECFEKTCKNVVYNLPESKPIMQLPAIIPEIPKGNPPTSDLQSIDIVLDNLKHMETNDFLYTNINADTVKSLLGNLYMELLFPHNDEETLFSAMDNINVPTFDQKA